jgi:hypothetical protein
MSNSIQSLVVVKIVQTPANKPDNYWSPLSCLVKEQEEEDAKHVIAKHLLLILTAILKLKVRNKMAEKWK